MIILALDALDFNMVKKYNCESLMQSECGQTSLSDFELERTVVLWASFLTGKNMEAKIPIKTQWEFKLKPEETFFRFFNTYHAIDVPAFSLKDDNHAKERQLLKAYFDEKALVDEYDKVIWKNHEENKKDFFLSIGHSDIVMGYFDLADAVGHLSFGVPEKIEKVYGELEEIARETKSSTTDLVLVISDHGMKEVGKYGDHSRNGFFSSSRKLGLGIPKITDFHDIVKELSEK